MFLVVGQLIGILDSRLVGQEGGCPDLTVGVGVGAAHDGPLVLKHLHPIILLPELCCLFHPPSINRLGRKSLVFASKMGLKTNRVITNLERVLILQKNVLRILVRLSTSQLLL